MAIIRNPTTAGMFYSANAAILKSMVEEFLKQANKNLPIPKAIIAPHAGLEYSGPIAASAYACLEKVKKQIQKVIVVGPCHRYPFEGIAVTTAEYYATPLGNIPIDQKVIKEILNLPEVQVEERAFNTMENSLETQFPFLQVILPHFKLVPLLVGDATVEEIAEVLRALWNGPETLIVISSDLSHYYDYDTANRIDKSTAEAIVNLSPEDVGYEQACGRVGVNALLTVAKEKGLSAYLIDLRNSGDTVGSQDQVVGYGAFHIR